MAQPGVCLQCRWAMLGALGVFVPGEFYKGPMQLSTDHASKRQCCLCHAEVLQYLGLASVIEPRSAYHDFAGTLRQNLCDIAEGLLQVVECGVRKGCRR